MVEKKSLFFYKVIFILANETKDNNRVYEKKRFLVICGLFEWKTHPGLRFKPKKSNFACKIFFRRIYILAQKQVCSQKRDKKFLSQFFVFYEKNA